MSVKKIKQEIFKKEKELLKLQTELENIESKTVKFGYLKHDIYSVYINTDKLDYDLHYTNYLSKKDIDELLETELCIKKGTKMYYNPNFGWYNDDFGDGFTQDWAEENLERISDV